MNMVDMSDIGELIRQLRTGRGWTQAELENKLWLDPGTVAAMERGNGDISFIDVASVLQLLGVRIMLRLPDKEG